MFSQIPSCLCTEAGEQLPESEPSHLAEQGDAQAVVLPAAASSSTQLQDREGEPSLGSLAALALCQAQPEPASLAEVPDGGPAAWLSALLLWHPLRGCLQ